MSKLSTKPGEQQRTMPARNATVVMGNQDFMSVLGRSIVGELYKIRRRAMSKILSTIAIAIILLVLFSTFSTSSHTLPTALSTALATINFMGPILFIILAGSVVGGEYSEGTIRLMLTRGPTRLQYLCAKLGAILICIVLTVVTLILLAIIVWMLLSLPAGIYRDASVLSNYWPLRMGLYLLVTILNLFIYSVLAACLATWGKASGVGITGILIWWFLENILSSVINLIGNSIHNAFGTFVSKLPDYFIGNNLAALRANQQSALFGGAPATISDLQAGIVVAVYLIATASISWWILKNRDITN
ncbi:ABC transporter permease [Dictyobacter arantiisoli]|uniref:ABC transporter permease n=1 Tax=Dictyobacter arantiisoli TaxID=2014874 RepID=A0A5A5TKH4_9CHLR|nr:ABC transporter permease [Dictyobacter arantiisoli]GCF11957.1 hypothetical protein KDI_55210 [Dictyobacter arantiisoli]